MTRNYRKPEAWRRAEGEAHEPRSNADEDPVPNSEDDTKNTQ